MNQIYNIEKKEKQNKIEKIAAIFIALIVLLFLGYGGYQIYKSSSSEKSKTETTTESVLDINSSQTETTTQDETATPSGRINGADIDTEVNNLDKSADATTESDFEDSTIDDAELGL